MPLRSDPPCTQKPRTSHAATPATAQGITRDVAERLCPVVFCSHFFLNAMYLQRRFHTVDGQTVVRLLTTSGGHDIRMAGLPRNPEASATVLAIPIFSSSCTAATTSASCKECPATRGQRQNTRHHGPEEVSSEGLMENHLFWKATEE